MNRDWGGQSHNKQDLLVLLFCQNVTQWNTIWQGWTTHWELYLTLGPKAICSLFSWHKFIKFLWAFPHKIPNNLADLDEVSQGQEFEHICDYNQFDIIMYRKPFSNFICLFYRQLHDLFHKWNIKIQLPLD